MSRLRLVEQDLDILSKSLGIVWVVRCCSVYSVQSCEKRGRSWSNFLWRSRWFRVELQYRFDWKL